MSTPAGDLVGSAHINVDANTDPARRALNDFARHTDGRLRDVRGRFVSESNLIGTSFNRAAGGGNSFNLSLRKLKIAAVALSPALLPIAAQAAPIAASAASVAAAGVAVAAFAVAAGGQVAALAEASKAEKKYKDAVEAHGAASKEATKAQAEYVLSVKSMPPATREAAAALSSFKDQYKEWSDSLADDTMPTLTKGLQTLGAVFPKLTPMVQGAGAQLERFVTIAAGGVASPGFDRFMDSFTRFAVGALERGNDALIRFARTVDTGKFSGGVAQFMEYVRENGPIVRETLSNLMQALSTLIQAAANVGPGILTVVNALAGLVAALPPGVITAMLQLAVAVKAVRLAVAGQAAVAAGVAAFTASIGAMRLAAAGATGVLPSLAAAIATLSRTAKVAIAGTGIGLLLIALSELSDSGRATAPDVDKLSRSFEKLGESGKATGTAAKEFGANFQGLRSQIDRVIDPSVVERVNNFGASITGGFLDAGDDTEKFTKSIESIDTALANLVSGGKAGQAEAAISVITKGMDSEQLARFNSGLGDYRDALADMRFEQKLTAQAMGLFGVQAQQTSAKLAEQKASADGLRQSIQALNETNRAALGAQNAFEQAIDDTAEAAKKSAGALQFVDGQLDLNSQKARDAEAALRDLAAKTDEAAAANRESTGSWQGAIAIYERGRQQLIANATQMGLTRDEAQKLAATILDSEDKSVMLKADITDWKKKIFEADKQLKDAKGEKRAKLTADIADWKLKVAQADQLLKRAKGDKRAKLTADISVWQAKVKQAELQLKNAKGDKRATLTANINDWRNKIAAAQKQVNSLPRSKTVYLTSVFTSLYRVRRLQPGDRGYGVVSPALGGATGGLYTGSGFKYRGKGYAMGGLVDGPGTETSDDVFAPWLSKNEFVVNAQRTRQFLPLLKAINSGGMAAGGMAGGGMASAGMDAGRGLALGMSRATSLVLAAAREMASVLEEGVRRELQISSPSKVFVQIGREIGRGFILGLTSTKPKIDQTADRISASITRAFKGRRSRVDDRLVAMVESGNRRLQSLAGRRDALAKRIADARKFATDTAEQARGTFSLQAITQGPEGVTGEIIRRGLEEAGAQIREFIGRINVLRKKGLSKSLLAQIIGLGPEAGLEFANVLSRQSTASIREINRLQGQIGKASTSLGRLSADALFDAGKKSGAGFLAGLKAQQKDIEKLMLSIAKGMQKAIRRALGIKSPSRVMETVGQLTVLGLQGGIVRTVPAIDRAMARVAGAVASGVPAALPAAVGRVPAPALGVGMTRTGVGVPVGGTVNITLNLTNQGVIGSQMELDNWLTRSIDRLGRTGRLPATVGR